MAINKGVAPPDMTSEVGKFRALIGDMTYTELVPPVPGYGDYELFSDDEIEVFLASSETPEGAAYLAYMQLSGQAAIESRTVKDFDLQVDLTKRATDLRLIAAMWADKDAAATSDVFELADVSIRDEDCRPELSAWPVRGICGSRLF